MEQLDRCGILACSGPVATLPARIPNFGSADRALCGMLLTRQVDRSS
jgi:hypothetical protein